MDATHQNSQGPAHGNAQSREEASRASAQPILLVRSVLSASRHVCAFFHSHEEEYRVLLPFIQEGFAHGEKAFHIVDPARRDAHLQRLAAAGIDTAAAQQRGHGDGIRAFAVHPGDIHTDLARFMTEDEKRAATGPFKTTDQGAATSVWCATSPQLDGKGGVYCVDCDIAEVIEREAQEGLYQVFNGVIPWAIDPDAAEHPWQLSEEMTGVKFSN